MAIRGDRTRAPAAICDQWVLPFVVIAIMAVVPTLATRKTAAKTLTGSYSSRTSTVQLPALDAELVVDLFPGRETSSPGDLVNVRGVLFFSADDGISGRELWKYDPVTRETTRIADINPGPASSSPTQLKAVGPLLFFSADDGTNGRELWRHDPRRGETALVYSPFLNPLDETALNEFAGIGGPRDLRTGYSVPIVRVVDGIRFSAAIGPASGIIDWDGDLGISSRLIASDINDDGRLGLLVGHDDWSNITYNFRNTRGISSAQFDPSREPELTVSEYLNGSFGSSDIDGDGIVNFLDNCVLVFNPGQADADGNGVGDACQEGAAADLAITQVVAPRPVVTGSNMTVTVNVTNRGPAQSSAVVVSDELPLGAEFVSCTATGGAVCGGSGNQRTIDLSSLAPGASVGGTLVAVVSCALANGATINNTASVRSATPDLDLTNNSTTAVAPVSNPPPTVAATLTPVGRVERDSRAFAVGFSVADNCDRSPSVLAVMDAPALSRGFAVIFKRTRGQHGRVIFDLKKRRTTLVGSHEAAMRSLLDTILSNEGVGVTLGQRLELGREEEERVVFVFSGSVLIREEASLPRLRVTARDSAGGVAVATALPNFRR